MDKHLDLQLRVATNETWDGSNWTSGGNDINTAQRYRRGAGSQTAGLAASGNGGSPPLTGETEQYNGTLGQKLVR